jgi:membrane-associated phospholipid phosphatase
VSISSIVRNPEPISPATALRYAALCVVGLALTWVAASLVPASHVQDAVALSDFTQLAHPRVDVLAKLMLALLDPPLYTLWAIALVGIALGRERPKVALAAALVLVLAPLSAEALKPLLAHPHAHVGYATVGAASWPSGHSTAAMTLALCAVLIAPRQARALVAACGCAFAIAVGFSLLVLAWHLPSDVFGGYLLAALWSSLAIAALALAERRWPSAAPRVQRSARVLPALASSLMVLLGVLLAVIAAFGILVGVSLAVRHRHLALFAVDHRALVVAAFGIATLAVLIASTLTAALRR